jgi:hypothetical protein
VAEPALPVGVLVAAIALPVLSPPAVIVVREFPPVVWPLVAEPDVLSSNVEVLPVSVAWYEIVPLGVGSSSVTEGVAV